MTALRWLLHCARCSYYRWQANDALADVHWSRKAQSAAHDRMHLALAREEQEQRAWAMYRKQMREVAE